MAIRNALAVLLAMIVLLPFEMAQASVAYVTNTVTPGGTLSVADLAKQKITANIPVNKYGPDFVVLSPDGSRAFVTNTTNADDNVQLSVIDTTSNKIISNIQMTESDDLGCDYVAINPGGTRAYVTLCSDSSSYIAVIDVIAGKVVTNIPLSKNSLPLGVAISPDGSKGFVADINSTNVDVFDTATNKITGSINIIINPYSITAVHTPTGDKAYFWGVGTTVGVIDIQTQKVSFLNFGIYTFISFYALAVNPAGTAVYVLGIDPQFTGQLVSVDTKTGKAITGNSFAATPTQITGLAVDSNGASVYQTTQSGSSNGQGIIVYDATGLQETGFIPMDGNQYDPLYIAVAPAATTD